MGDNSKIEWCDATWNPVRGCSRVSSGCTRCYAETVAARFSGPGLAYEGLARRTASGEARWTGEVRVVPEHLDDPLRWKRPRRIFVNSMSDLFHERLTNQQIAVVFGVMAAAKHHTFQVLTKRPARMRDWFEWANAQRRYGGAESDPGEVMQCIAIDSGIKFKSLEEVPWPLPNVWLGVSVENQPAADERVPLLLQTPAAVRFLSCEPLLGVVDISTWLGHYPVHEAESRNERGSGLSGSSPRGTSDRSGRPDMAGHEPRRQPMVRQRDDIQVRQATRRPSDWVVSPSPRDGEQQAIAGSGTSAGMEAFLRSDTRWPDNQSQERRQGRQPSSQLRTGDLFGTDYPRLASPQGWADGPERSAQRDVEANRVPSERNPPSPTSWREAALNSGDVRHIAASGVENRSRGAVGISWCIVGGESGPGARPMHPDWARSLRDQCKAAGVPFFFKQWGEWAPRRDGVFGPLDVYMDDDGATTCPGGEPLLFRGQAIMSCVGKKAAGSLLDGVEHKAFPA